MAARVSEEGHDCNRPPSSRTEPSELLGEPPWGVGCRQLRESRARGLRLPSVECSAL